MTKIPPYCFNVFNWYCQHHSLFLQSSNRLLRLPSTPDTSTCSTGITTSWLLIKESVYALFEDLSGI